MSTKQLNDEEYAEFERIVRAKVVALLLDTEWDASIGDQASDPAANHHIRNCLSKICNEILGDITMPEYVQTLIGASIQT